MQPYLTQFLGVLLVTSILGNISLWLSAKSFQKDLEIQTAKYQALNANFENQNAQIAQYAITNEQLKKELANKQDKIITKYVKIATKYENNNTCESQLQAIDEAINAFVNP